MLALLRSAWVRIRPHAAKIVASLVLGAGFLWMFRTGGLPLIPSAEVMAGVGVWAWPSAIATIAAATYLRTYRWIYLLRPIASDLPRWRVLGIGFVGFAAVVFAPLRAGEVARPYLLAQDGRITFAQGMGTVGAERIIDGLVVTILTTIALLVAVPISPLPDHLGTLPVPVNAISGAVKGALALFSGAFLAMGAFYFARDLAKRVVERVVGIVSLRLARFLSGTVERLADGLSFLPSWRASGPFLRDTAVYWAVLFFGYAVTLRECGATMAMWEVVVLVGVMGLGSLIPAGPGFFGAYQMSAFAGMAMFLPERVVLTSGAAFIFIAFSCHIGGTFLSALIGWWLLRRFPNQPILVELGSGRRVGSGTPPGAQLSERLGSPKASLLPEAAAEREPPPRQGSGGCKPPAGSGAAPQLYGHHLTKRSSGRKLVSDYPIPTKPMLPRPTIEAFDRHLLGLGASRASSSVARRSG